MKTVENDKQAELYAAFLLRLWRESAEKPWRASLQSGLDGRQRYFVSLAALIAYLEALPPTGASDELVLSGGYTMTNTGNSSEPGGSIREEPAAGAGPKETEIRHIVQRMADGWNAGDGPASVSDYAEDAVHIVWNGSRHQGREAVAQGHQYIFDHVYHDRQMEMEVTAIHWLRPDVALAEVVARLRSRQNGTWREAEARPLVVLTREGGTWQVRAFQNTLVQEPERKAT